MGSLKHRFHHLLSGSSIYGWVFGLILLPMNASADCGPKLQGDIRILSNDFASLRLVMNRAADCAGGPLSVSVRHSIDHKALQVPALSRDPAGYDVVVIANNSLPPLLEAGLVRPLDELVATHGRQLTRSQLIRIDGQVMAVAFMVNGMHLFTRADILKRAGVDEVPKSWEDVLAAAERIRSAGIMRYPLAGAYEPGWELAQAFVNMFTAAGGAFFEPGTATPRVNSAEGIAALEMIGALTKYMPPDYLSVNALEAAKRWKAGDVAIMNLWASQAGDLIRGRAVSRNTVLSAAPTLAGNGIPGGTLFWDGFAIASNISDQNAESAFRVMMHAVAPELAAEHPTGASWIVRGSVPTLNSMGIMANVGQGSVNYPTSIYMERMHTALGEELGDYLRGLKTAEEALRDVERNFIKSAGTKKFLD